MCGIDGFCSGEGEVDALGYYDAHLTLRHRGPDDEGFLVVANGQTSAYRGDDSVGFFAGLPHVSEVRSADVLLGHRRLSIIDLTHHGHQPLADETGRYSIVFNGEIFNYLELRGELASLGHVFASDSDTEVMLKAYIEWGTDCLDRLNGMWAAAIWDSLGRRLLLTRDHFGIKPLYYTIVGNTLYFASEMKFLLRLHQRRWHLNERMVADYLYRSWQNHTTETFFDGIHELEPATCATWDGRELDKRRFWNYTPHLADWNEEEAVLRFGELFEDSLRLRMRSDVEVGTLLSGGLDSSLIVCALHELGFVPSDREFKTFSAVFEEDEFSERKYVEDVLSRVPAVPFFVTPGPDGLSGRLDMLFRHLEEPFRSLSTYTQMSIYEAVSRQTRVKVLLNGQGGDELFGGYTNDFYTRFAELAATRRFFRLLDEARLFHRNRGVDYRTIWRRTRVRMADSTSGPDLFNRTTFSMLSHSALREYLKYDDRTSMAYGLETRPPFLDRRLVEFAFTLPSDMKIRGLAAKWVEREYARDLVPASVVDRTDKMGFVSPQPTWQRRELAADLKTSLLVLDQALSFGSPEESRRGKARYEEYLRGDNDDWAFVWRAHCLTKWLEYNQDLLAWT